MHLWHSFHYSQFKVWGWNFNTSKNSINPTVKKIFWIILHPNPSIQSPVASGVGGCSRQDRQNRKSRIWSGAGWFRVPCATLASLSQLRVGWSVWALPWVCSAFPGPNPVIQRPTTSRVSGCSRQNTKIQNRNKQLDTASSTIPCTVLASRESTYVFGDNLGTTQPHSATLACRKPAFK